MQTFDVGDYFRGTEGLYSENLVTEFDVTKRFTLRFPHAQLAYLNRMAGDWAEMVAVNSNLRVVEILFKNVGSETYEYVDFFSKLIAPGSLARPLEKHFIFVDGVMNKIKKDLAMKVLKRFPFFDYEEDILIAAYSPFYIKFREREELKKEYIQEFFSRPVLSEIVDIFSVDSITVKAFIYNPDGTVLDFIVKAEVFDDISYEVAEKFLYGINEKLRKFNISYKGSVYTNEAIMERKYNFIEIG